METSKAAQVRELLARDGMTQSEIADKVGVTRQYVSQIKYNEKKKRDSAPSRQSTKERKYTRRHVDTVRSFPCPHCKQEIELVGQSEFDEDEGLRNGNWKLTPPRVKRLREAPGSGFPEPALVFPNRAMWTRYEIENYMRRRRELEVEQDVDKMLDKPREQLEEIMRQLAERLNK